MKSLDPISFDLARCRVELDQFKALLDSVPTLGEREHIMPLFRCCRNLTALLGMRIPELGRADRLAYEFPIFGDFAADIVLSSSETQVVCAIELEDAGPDSVFQKVGHRSTPEWSRRFERGFSQLVDWFYAWDDHKSSVGFAKHFGFGHVVFAGLRVIGRSTDMSVADRSRLRWRSDRVVVNSHKIYCRTYDELYDSLNRDWQVLSSVSHARPDSGNL